MEENVIIYAFLSLKQFTIHNWETYTGVLTMTIMVTIHEKYSQIFWYTSIIHLLSKHIEATGEENSPQLPWRKIFFKFHSSDFLMKFDLQYWGPYTDSAAG